MHFCSVCQKTPASIVLMDLNGGSVTDQQHLCAPCAEKLGVVQPKNPDKYPSELIEDLLGAVQGQKPPRPKKDSTCAGCGMTVEQFRTGGRMGCPRCYDTFRSELIPLLQRVHESSQHRGRLPARHPVVAAAPGEDLVDLRRRLDDAVRSERYEEAARLRDELQKAEIKAEPGA